MEPLHYGISTNIFTVSKWFVTQTCTYHLLHYISFSTQFIWVLKQQFDMQWEGQQDGDYGSALYSVFSAAEEDIHRIPWQFKTPMSRSMVTANILAQLLHHCILWITSPHRSHYLQCESTYFLSQGRAHLSAALASPASCCGTASTLRPRLSQWLNDSGWFTALTVD